ncbi:MAG: transcriptional repressor [Coriobacteriales bacterium]|nr:transcriptional repressor [Coriobacteriales bacterium]
MSREQLQWPEGVKRTKQRESVFAVLQNAERPLSAMEICTAIDKLDGAASAWLSTVYRVLELFVEKDVVVKTSLINSDMALYELNRLQHKHYATCIKCHKIIALDNCPMEQSAPPIENGSFQVIGHRLEFFGYCKDCSKTLMEKCGS